MPRTAGSIRNYRQEYDRFHANPKQKKRRAQRNAARSKMKRLGKVSKGDGKDVDHRSRNTANNSLGNLRVQAASTNRSTTQLTKQVRKIGKAKSSKRK